MEMKFKETAEEFSGRLKQYDAYPKAKDRSAYEQLPARLKEEILSEGMSYVNYQYPSILATDYMRFKRTGNRVDFENIYFSRRHALCALTLAECVEYQGRFLDDIINGVFALCEESGWQLPPHNSYVRDAAQYILPDSDRPVIDLFAAETGALLAWAAYLLDDALDAVSPFITSRIRSELHKRILLPYATQHFWWMGQGEEPMCNWTPWCTQNILLTAFLLPGEEELQKKIFVQAAASCDFFLKDYGEDGCCDEGAQYFRHAGLCLFGAMDILNYISQGAVSTLFEDRKIKNIAAYILNVHIDGEYYVNFADCSAKPGRCGMREYLFGKATRQSALCSLAAKDFRAGEGRLYTGETDQINLYYMLQTCFHHEEVLQYKGTDTVFEDIYYESVGLFLARSTSFFLAAKAGDNDDNHNHNDTGNFILYKNGKPVFVDIGVASYTQKTFSPQRYEIWTMQSGYHNLPTLCKKDQNAGADYRATDVVTLLNCDAPEISMELAGAYPLQQFSYKRRIKLDKTAEEVTLTDVTDCPEATLNFITYEKPVVTNNTISIGNLAKCTFSGADLLTVETLPITDKRLKKAWDHELYRVQLNMTTMQFIMTIR